AAVRSSAPPRAVISTFSTVGLARWPLSAILVARPASPIAPSSCVALTCPAMLPPAKQTATNTTQSAMARHGRSALHRATRTVNGLFPTSDPLPLPIPVAVTLSNRAGQDIRARPRPDPDFVPRMRPQGLPEGSRHASDSIKTRAVDRGMSRHAVGFL